MASALFDRRTWPATLEFDKEQVQQKLDILMKKFPQAQLAALDAGVFIQMAKRAMAEYALHRNRQGHVTCKDCLQWVQGILQ